MKSMKIMAVALLMCVSLVACGQDDGSANDDEIRVGINFALTGPYASYGTSTANGVKLAIKEINDAGGINGKKIKIIEVDNKSETTEAVTLATKLTTEEDVVATIGPEVSLNTKSAIVIANKNKIPLLSPTATNDDVTKNKDGSVTEYGYKTCFNDSFQGKALAKFASDKGKKKAIIYGDSASDYSKMLAKSFKEGFEEFGGSVVDEVYYVEKDTDFNATLTKIKSEDFDVLYVPGYYNEAGLIIKQARDLGIDTMILGPDGFDSPTLTELATPEYASDIFFTTHFSSADGDDDVSSFMKNYKAEYSQEADSFAALGYDLGKYFGDVLTRAGDDITAKTVKKALDDFEAVFDGITGTFTMGEDHVPVKEVKVVELQNGKAESVVNVDVK
ncbi:MAG: ABC transporter substrate-binding protein [Breznakia sp.]